MEIDDRTADVDLSPNERRNIVNNRRGALDEVLERSIGELPLQCECAAGGTPDLETVEIVCVRIASGSAYHHTGKFRVKFDEIVEHFRDDVTIPWPRIVEFEFVLNTRNGVLTLTC